MHSYISLIPSMHIDHLIDMAIDEDIGSGDITTNCLPDGNAQGVGKIMAKEPIVIAGLDVVKRVFVKLDNSASFSSSNVDGDKIGSKQVFAQVTASISTLLIAERTALNFLQRLSGIATHVSRFVEIVKDKPIRLVDTRKTMPGWRALEKYAVRVGGAHNHRMGLYDGVLIKDNHIAAFGSISRAIHHVRKQISHLIKIEVEVSDVKGVQEALEAGADVIMLDNMNIDEMKSAVRLINRKAVVEASGNVNRESLPFIADTGVDIVSMGALTHSAISVDISMKIE